MSRKKEQEEKKGHLKRSQIKSSTRASVSNVASLRSPRPSEALRTANALASAECARSLIKDPADDRRLCEHGGFCVWVPRNGVSRGVGERKERKKREKKEKQGKSDKEGILFKRIIGCRENKDFFPLRFAYFALNFWLSGIFCEAKAEKKKIYSQKLFLPTLFGSFTYILVTQINFAQRAKCFLYLLEWLNTSSFDGEPTATPLTNRYRHQVSWLKLL